MNNVNQFIDSLRSKVEANAARYGNKLPIYETGPTEDCSILGYIGENSFYVDDNGDYIFANDRPVMSQDEVSPVGFTDILSATFGDNFKVAK